mmetsp:Transcript_6950/g.16738  ORF Transcript_6950/g.16738 Transcript_6950/m.16738 type:complete len:272 (+) Transcript_6950:407-1222(+)
MTLCGRHTHRTENLSHIINHMLAGLDMCHVGRIEVADKDGEKLWSCTSVPTCHTQAMPSCFRAFGGVMTEIFSHLACGQACAVQQVLHKLRVCMGSNSQEILARNMLSVHFRGHRHWAWSEGLPYPRPPAGELPPPSRLEDAVDAPEPRDEPLRRLAADARGPDPGGWLPHEREVVRVPLGREPVEAAEALLGVHEHSERVGGRDAVHDLEPRRGRADEGPHVAVPAGNGGPSPGDPAKGRCDSREHVVRLVPLRGDDRDGVGCSHGSEDS